MRTAAKAEREPLSEEAKSTIEKYFRQEYEGLLRVAKARLSAPDLAETAVQDTFLLAGYRYEKFISSPKPVGWLYTTLKYIISNMHRADLKLTKYILSIDDANPLDISTTDTYPSLDLTKSEDPDIRLLAQFYVERVPAKELAEKLGINLGACKMRIKRARQRLEEKLRHEE